MKHELGQSRKHAALEQIVNVGSGMLLAFLISQGAAYFEPWIQEHIWSGFVWNVGVGSNAAMTIVLTFVSMGRGYGWRRAFNRLTYRK